ncbi:hypothetical protein FSARC_12690 [Fusarium sarcochroum]|uniref:NFX1-type zinc finger-containing protein 1 n=1 Tax=Fusarium sarcochroum TaxID=1208366 RepID=A0A8H4T6Q2_9HYPO|nr:hypothetical protein FSARC_12690 [Fusarium sarcochroum]
MAAQGHRGIQPQDKKGARQDDESDGFSHKPPCRQFQNGKCRHGDDCKFSHTTSYLETTDADALRRLLQLKSVLRKDILKDMTHPSDAQTALKVWSIVLAILDSDCRDQHQELAKVLVDDEFCGQQCIIATVRRISFSDGPYKPCLRSFIRVITHPSLLTCLAIESYTSTIYAQFGGTNGEHGIDLLSRICTERLSTLKTFTGTLEPIPYEGMLAIVKACHELLCRAPRTRLCDALPDFVKILDKLVTNMDEKFPSANLDALHSRLDVLKRLVTGATTCITGAQEPESERQDMRDISSSFKVPVENPGGRHDNDFADISKIAILPTINEITRHHTVYLPSTNFLHPHALKDPLQRYIDSAFRLFRHDTIGPVSDILRDLLSSSNPLAGRLSSKDLRADTYLECRVQEVSYTKWGLEAELSFLTPYKISNWSIVEQEIWWEDSPRLEQGRLLCFIFSRAKRSDLLFFQVTAKKPDRLAGKNAAKHSVQRSLTSEKSLPSITVKLAARQRVSVGRLVRLFVNGTKGVLVDFNGVIPGTYMPTFESLLRIQRENHVPFHRWMLPTGSGDTNIPPPLYARKEGFVFPLGCISKNKATLLQLDPSLGLNGIDLAELEAQTGLDGGQCHGLVAALTREYALIQGPPGTGKSYLGVQLVRTLLAVRTQAKLGPIVVSCYTNHALDQFLEHLLDVGIDRIVRIGGRSTVPKLDNKNLRSLRNRYPGTSVEDRELKQAYEKLDNSTRMGMKAIADLRHSRIGRNGSDLLTFISETRPKIHQQLVPTKKSTSWGISGDHLETWLGKTRPITAVSAKRNLEELTERAEKDIDSLSSEERWALRDHWANELLESQVDLAFEASADSERYLKNVEKIKETLDQRVLAQAQVIGITITTAARRIDLLKSLSPKVMICEEAAEVMEAHLISTLIPGIEHLIQIGDHEQLRPQINNFELGLESGRGHKWQLDRSQFERRAVGEPGLAPVPLAQLNVQRRMRPEFSQLIRSVYPALQDHPSVLNRPGVVGMRHNLFWLDHNHMEDSCNDPVHVTSHSNRWEANMATALVRHLIRQREYKPEDIALLTPYAGQLRRLTIALSKENEVFIVEKDTKESAQDEECEENPATQVSVEKRSLTGALRLATVDNFQGEEAKIIVVSLVRNNPLGKVGFLRTENRINVLLSRARHGMYLIGNSSTYLHVPMWADVHAQLSDAAAVGKEIELCCPRHPDTPIPCSEPAHFAARSPAGGRHAIPKSCTKLFPVSSLVLAFDQLPVHDVELPCGHITKSLQCSQTLDLPSVKCEVRVQKTVPGCGHNVTVDCSLDISLDEFCCPNPYALERVMLEAPVVPVSNLARFNVHTLLAALHATRRAPRALSHVLGLVPIEDPAQCLVRLHATASQCGGKGEARVDLLEFRSYNEIDLDENPIVVLGCGHFFTGETLDGLVGLNEVYLKDAKDQFVGLEDVSCSLSRNIPFCPDCKQPIRQYATKRYNRLVNRAVMDETYKRLLIKEREELHQLEKKLDDVENDLATTRSSFRKTSSTPSSYLVQKRQSGLRELRTKAKKITMPTKQEGLPTRILVDAIAISQARRTGDSLSIARQMEALRLSQNATKEQTAMRARLVEIKAQGLQLQDGFAITATNMNSIEKWLKDESLPSLSEFLDKCKTFVKQAEDANLPRIAITGTIAFANIARLLYWFRNSELGQNKERSLNAITAADQSESAIALLNAALVLCSKLSDGEELKQKIQEAMGLFDDGHEDITPEELASIKSAMVSGSGGMATNSGHWYNCVNGHPFAIGECGMPMETARCPECGAHIGGINHQPVEGVTRAEDME